MHHYHRWLTTILLSIVTAAAWAKETLYIYNWSDYFAPETISRFEKETGIDVIYDVYDSNDMLEAKLYAGNTGYDVVFPTNFPYFLRQQQVGVYQPLNTELLPNLKNADALFVDPLRVDGKLMAAPYMWGTIAIGINQAKVAPLFDGKVPDSWSLIFEPENIKKLSGCKVVLFDSPVYLYPILLNYLGLKPGSHDYADYEKASQRLHEIRPYITYFHDSQYLNDLANGNICAAVGWAGDMVIARNRALNAKNGVKIDIFNPKEGTLLLFDVMAIPKTAQHVEAAHAFINYLLRPDVVAEITNYTGFPNAESVSVPLLKPEVAKDPAIYPPESARKTFFLPGEIPVSLEKRLQRDWAKMKAGER